MSHLYLVLPCAWQGNQPVEFEDVNLMPPVSNSCVVGRIDLELDLVIGIGQHDLLVRIRFARENATRELDDDAASRPPQ